MSAFLAAARGSRSSWCGRDLRPCPAGTFGPMAAAPALISVGTGQQQGLPRCRPRARCPLRLMPGPALALKGGPGEEARAMKRVVVDHYGGPEVLKVVDEDDPRPGPGEVRVKVLAAGVSFTDAQLRAGTYLGVPPPPFTSSPACRRGSPRPGVVRRGFPGAARPAPHGQDPPCRGRASAAVRRSPRTRTTRELGVERKARARSVGLVDREAWAPGTEV